MGYLTGQALRHRNHQVDYPETMRHQSHCQAQRFRICGQEMLGGIESWEDRERYPVTRGAAR